MHYKLSPSDFAFLYEGCKCCYYRKVVYGIYQPSISLPSIFSKIATLLKNHYDGKRTQELHVKLPLGVVKYGERYVKSNPIQLTDHKSTCFISGRFDIVVEFDDKTYGVVDFKTGNPNEEYRALYNRQLNAYAYALEHAAPGALGLSPISQLGLLYFYPSKISQSNIEWLSYDAEVQWVEVEKDEKVFLDFVGDVLRILSLDKPPISSPDCIWCNYIRKIGDMSKEKP